MPAVGDRGVADGHLHRRDRQALADRQVAHRRARVLLEVEQDAALLAGQVDAGRAAEAEAADPGVEPLGAESQADHDRADVGGLLEDLARGERPVAGVVGLADLAVGHGDRRRDVEARVRRHLALLERGRDGERLEGRAGLVGGADRAVLARVVGRVAERVGVHPRPVGEREDGAVARVHDDRRRALRLPLLADLGEHLLGAVLHVGVEREADVGAGRRCACTSRSSIASPSASLVSRRSPSLAAEVLVERVLEARRGRCRRCRCTPSSCEAIQSRG